jgi:hypothetical protein
MMSASSASELNLSIIGIRQAQKLLEGDRGERHLGPRSKRRHNFAFR